MKQSIVEVIHYLPGRVRFRVSFLYRNQDVKLSLEKELRNLPGIIKTDANPLTGSLLIFFDCATLSIKQLRDFILKPLLGQEEAAAVSQTGLYPRKIEMQKYLPLAALLGGWWLTKNRTFRPTSFLKFPSRGLGLAAEIWGYSVLFQGISHSIKQKRFDPNIIVGATALLAASTGLAQVSMAYLFLTQLVDSLKRFQGEDSPSLSTGQIALPAVAALLTLYLTGNRQRALIPLMAGYPLALSLTTALPQSTLLNPGTGKEWVALRPDTVSRSSGIDTVLFSDATLISGHQQAIKDIISLDPSYSNKQLLMIATAAYQHQEGPLARDLVHQSQIAQLPLLTLDKLIWEKGKGIKGFLESYPVLVGNGKLLKSEGVSISSALPFVWRLKHLCQNPIYISVNNKLIGLVGISHEINNNNRALLEGLRASGITRFGVFREDSENMNFYRDYGIIDYGPLSSQVDQALIIQQLQNAGHRVAVIGQEVSDLPAMKAANLAIVFTDAKPQLWNFAHLAIDYKDPSKLGGYFHQINLYHQVVRQNLSIVSGQTAVGSALGLAGNITPWSTLLLQAATGLFVVWNSWRGSSHAPNSVSWNALHEVAATVLPFDYDCTFQHPESGDSKLSLVQDLGKRLQDSRFLWHSLSGEEIVKLMSSNEQGLCNEEAELRLQVFFPNRLIDGPGLSFWQLLKKQFDDMMVKILLGASGFCLIARKYTDATAIITILLINAIMGVIQEIKAHKSLKSLKTLTAPTSDVIRDGKQVTVSAEQLVPGDIIMLNAGDRVPADAVLLRSVHLEAEESSLTGETCPMIKRPGVIAPDTPLAERTNVLFMGTCITRGTGIAIVVATGMATEVGKIAGMMLSHETQELTPLQQTLKGMSKFMVSACLMICGVIFSLGLLRGERVFDMFLTAVSMAVAAIPEGLTAIVTIALTLGVYRMSKSNMIVRHLPALETLGCASVICTDKTGTITKNEMTVREIYCWQESFHLTGEGFAPEGKVFMAKKEIDRPSPRLSKLLTTGVLCNNSHLSHEKERYTVRGDTTEGALLTAAVKMGVTKEDYEKIYPRVEEIPFDADRRLMTVICREPEGSMVAFSKGAPEVILSSCSKIWDGSHAIPINTEMRKEFLFKAEQMAQKTFRVMALAWKPLRDYAEFSTEVEKDLIFCGLAGILDPPRPEVKKAIMACKSAGIKVIMISGDHPLTVEAVSKEIGLHGDTATGLITGQELDSIDDTNLSQIIDKITLVARAAPHHKLRLIKILKQQGHVVVMTGDGVNDAPAVKEADIGVAMGINGADLTKDVSSLVLTDDHFATIVKAIKEGRSIFANIRHAIRYLVSTNIGEVVTMLGATLLGMPLPLTPLMLLWINLAGDGLPAVALVADPPDPQQMTSPPRKISEGLFNETFSKKIIKRGLLIGLGTVFVFGWGLRRGITVARSLALGVLGVGQFIHLFDCRKEDKETQVKLLNNKYLLFAGTIGLAMILAAIQVPGANRIFQTTPLFTGEWVFIWSVSLLTALLDNLGGALCK